MPLCEQCRPGCQSIDGRGVWQGDDVVAQAWRDGGRTRMKGGNARWQALDGHILKIDPARFAGGLNGACVRGKSPGRLFCFWPE